MIQELYGATTFDTSTLYQGPNGVAASGSAFPYTIPGGCTLGNLSIELNTAPGVGTSRTWTLHKNGSPTSVTVTISGTDTTGSYVGTESYAAGDTMNVVHTVSGSPTTSIGRWILEADIAADNHYFVFGYCIPNHTSGTNYMHGLAGSSGVAGNQKAIVPHNITVKSVYITLSAAPSAGQSRTYTWTRPDGTGSGTAPAITIADAATTGSQTGLTWVLDAGATAMITSTVSGTPASANSRVSYYVEGPNDTEIAMFNNTNVSITSGRYRPALLGGAQGSFSATNTLQSTGSTKYMRSLYAWTSDATSLDNTITLDVDSVLSALAVNCTANIASNTSDEVELLTTNDISWKNTYVSGTSVTPVGTGYIVSTVSGISTAKKSLALLGVG